ncbi:MAG: alpha/beta hydrolase family esterase [Hyphomicrobiaceae bacterium]
MIRRLLLITLAIGAIASDASACGVNSDCKIGDRIYRIRMPAGHDGVTPVGAILFAHGYKGNVRGAVKSKGIAHMGRRLNVAIISAKSAHDDWSIPGAPSGSSRKDIDELAYFDRVIDDAARRFPIDRNRLMATGSSAGGMMVWNLACHRSNRIAAFVPVSGTFWQPMPETCTTPVTSIVHVHGTADKVVPLNGRKINEARQGVVRDAIAMYARYGAFGQPTSLRVRDLECEIRNNGEGHVLNFCLHSGGHVFRIRHVERAWEMFVKAGKL